MATVSTLAFSSFVAESSRIINAHSRHFLSLCVLFLLPLSTLILAFPAVSSSVRPKAASKILLQYVRSYDLGSTVGAFALYAAAVVVLTVSAIATITNSFRQGFFERPVKFRSSIRFLPACFLKLIITLACVISIFAAFSLAIAAVTYLGCLVAASLGLHVMINSPPVVLTIGAAALALIGILFLSRWALFSAVVVLESQWGFKPLRRSSYLLSGARGVSICLGLFFWGGITAVIAAGFVMSFSDGLSVVVGTVCGLAVMILLILYGLASNVLLYMYCKAMHGELVGLIAEEAEQDYVNLPSDQHKLPSSMSILPP